MTDIEINELLEMNYPDKHDRAKAIARMNDNYSNCESDGENNAELNEMYEKFKEIVEYLALDEKQLEKVLIAFCDVVGV